MRFLFLLLLWPALALGQGLVVKGPIGNFGGCAYGPARPDAEIEITNCTLGAHALLSIYQNDWTDEAGISFATLLADTSRWQMAGVYSRLVGGINAGSWKGVFGVHVIGAFYDSTDILAYPNNAVRLAAGPTTSTIQDRVPPSNTVDMGDVGMGVSVLLHDVANHPEPVLGGTLIYTKNGGVLYARLPDGTIKQLAP